MHHVAIRGSVFVGTLSSVICYDHFNPGFSRSIQFWTTLAPTIIEYQFIKAKARLEGEQGLADLDRRIEEFHGRTALKTLDIITSLGGIYVKLAQFAAAMGSGIILDDYIQALQPLMDGVPPRPLETIIEIIEQDFNQLSSLENNAISTTEEGKKVVKLCDIFESFDETCLGAASIAQAHRATLRDGREVVVKVQYPEVAANYIADFDNLEILAGFFLKESVETVKNLRKRHEFELDFRLEAANLELCGRNAEKHGFSPGLVAIPKLIDICPPTKNVLVMEYLKGESMQTVIDEELSEIATALGVKGGVKQLRKQTMLALKQHFREGGGERSPSSSIESQKTTTVPNSMMKTILGSDRSSSSKQDELIQQLEENNDVEEDDLKGKEGRDLVSFLMKSAQYLMSHGYLDQSTGLRLLKSYVGIGKWFKEIHENMNNAYTQFKYLVLNLFSGYGLLFSMDQNVNNNNQKEQEFSNSSCHQGRIVGMSDGSQIQVKNTKHQKQNLNKNEMFKKKRKKINLDEKLKQLIQVHGYQLLIDGVFNADPHPGNILVLEDGTLGLIDYGIVGCLTLEERLLVAKVIVALAEDNLDEAARIYLESGYRIVDLTGHDQPASLVGRIARFHLDKIDLSLIQLHREKTKDDEHSNVIENDKENERTSTNEVSSLEKSSKPQSILRVLHQSMELSAPDWCLQSRRLGCLLIGVCTQAGRPISLAKEWEPIARQLLAEHQEPGTLPTHFEK